MNKLLLFVAFFLANLSFSQTFTGSGGPILDQNTVSFNLNVAGLTSNIDTVNFGLESVCINLNHTYLADLEIRLIAPSGEEVILLSGIGGGGDNLVNTCFNADASTSIASGTAPFTGEYTPSGQLGFINAGVTGNGNWILKVTDNAANDVGNLINWKLIFGTNPATYSVFTSSNLPIVVINTNGQSIQDDPKIAADMGIIFNGAGVRNYVTDVPNNYNGKVGIEYRGSSSQMFPKKPFGIELWDVNNNSIDDTLLGMPAESDWVLNVSYSDKSLLRNAFTYRNWEKMGHYGSRGQQVELILNGQYWGVYYLCEKIKRGSDRLDIAKLQPTEITGDDLTGGYILKVDKTTGSATSNWSSMYPPADQPAANPPLILVEYPKIEDIVPQQLDYIKKYVDSFEIALQTVDFLDTNNGYRHFADEASWIDYLLLSEMNKNVDGYRISTYFYKDKNSNGGKLKMGPVWDYDLAYGNANYCDGWKPEGWGFEFNNVCGGDGWLVPFWWSKMMQDTLFQNNMRCRWENLKPVVFDTTVMFHWIDSMAIRLQESQSRNFEQWPIIGTYVWPNYYIPSSYQGEIDSLKWWLKARFEWLDANIPGNLVACGFTGIDELNQNFDVQVYPNPFENQVTLQFDQLFARGTVLLYTIHGELIHQLEIPNLGSKTTFSIDASLTNGIYFLVVETDKGRSITKKLVKQ